MKKLDKDLYLKHAKRLRAIINEKSTFVSFLHREDFKQTIKNELNVLAACEKLFPKLDVDQKLTAKSLAKQFNKLTNGDFKIDEHYKYDDETDLIDSINYLFTFCNNMFKVNLDDLVSGKNITATDPKIDLRAKPDIEEEAPKVSPNFAFAGGGVPLATTPYENPYLVGKAYAKLNDDMKQGKFYRFKTQPKIVPIMKIISCCLLALLCLSLIIMGVFAFMANNLAVSQGEQHGILGGIASGVIYIIVGCFAIYPIYMTLRTVVGKDSVNLNLKFHFSWGIIMGVLALSFLMTMLDLNRTWLMPFKIDNPSGSAFIGWVGWKIMFLVTCGLIGANIIPLVVGSVCNPKPDPEAVEKRIKEYIDLFSAEVGNPVPPKADQQKPIETKPSKDSKKKK